MAHNGSPQPDAGLQSRSSWRHWFKPDGRRLEDMMVRHGKEPHVDLPFLAAADTVHRRLRSARL